MSSSHSRVGMGTGIDGSPSLGNGQATGRGGRPPSMLPRRSSAMLMSLRYTGLRSLSSS